MFMIVTFPWPVPSANIEPEAPGGKARRAHASTHIAATARNLNQAAQDEFASEAEQRRRVLTARKA